MTTADNDLSGRELEPAFGRSLPAPHTLVGELRARLESTVLALRAERGEVHAPEDVWESVRALGAIAEGLADYGSAFSKVAKETRGYIQDELEVAVGEQDGIPNSGMSVPDVDGTNLQISLDVRNEYDIDIEPVKSGVLALVLATNPAMILVHELQGQDAVVDTLAELLADAMTTLLACGTFRPQVTKVRALATEIGRTDPKVASTINGALSRAKSVKFQGVKVKREQPK